MSTYAGERRVRGRPVPGTPARRAGRQRVGADPRQGDARRAALRGGRHQGEGVVQQRVHLLPRLLDARLRRHVGRRWGGVSRRGGGGPQEDVVGGGGAPVRGAPLALVGVRLEGTSGTVSAGGTLGGSHIADVENSSIS